MITYAEAADAAMAGKMARRPEWGTQYITAERNWRDELVLYKRTPGYDIRHRYFATRADRDATDWEIIQ